MDPKPVFLVWCECPCGVTAHGQLQGAQFSLCAHCGEYATSPFTDYGERVKGGVGVVGEIGGEQWALRRAHDLGRDYEYRPRVYEPEALLARSEAIKRAKLENPTPDRVA